MKLFDRSVDLAQFSESTPLYPICRAWMRNQPHNRNMTSDRRSRTPSPPPMQEDIDVRNLRDFLSNDVLVCFRSFVNFFQIEMKVKGNDIG